MDKGQQVYKIVSGIPKGKVTTYQAIAKKAGIRNPRLVGHFLHINPDPVRIPCHRVVTVRGNLASGYAFGGREAQSEKLMSERVPVVKGKVNIKKYYWTP